jgi:hypothetical protein
MVFDKFAELVVGEFSLLLIFAAHLLYSYILFSIIGRNTKHQEKRWFVAILSIAIVTCPYWLLFLRKTFNNNTPKEK